MQHTQLIAEKFSQDFKFLQDNNKSFHEIVMSRIEVKEISKSKFSRKTGLEDYMYDRVKNPDYNRKHSFSMRSVVGICIGLELDVQTSKMLLNLLGMTFSNVNRVHQAYRRVIECSSSQENGITIDKCNEFLRDCGIEEKHFLKNCNK